MTKRIRMLRYAAAMFTVVGGASLSLVLAQAPSSAATPHLMVAPVLIQFAGGTTLGTYTESSFALTNNGGSTDTIDLTDPKDLSFGGSGADDYIIVQAGGCPGNGSNIIVLAPGAECNMDVFFFPGGLGEREGTATITGTAGSPAQISFDAHGTIGYYQVDEFGDVAHYGDAHYFGDTGSDNLNAPVVGMATTGDNGGYWLVSSDGGIFNFGPSAQFFGSTGGLHLNQPIVGMAATPDAGGYWLVASDGGIFAYGDAQFYGSTGGMHLNKPIVGMASTPDGGGYWLVASDGGIFAYGDAPFYGSTGAIHLNKPIVGMASAPNGGGYWLVASDGGIFAYGDAQFYGSAGSLNLTEPISAMAAMPDASGYWLSAEDSGLFNYGAPFYGPFLDNPNLDVVVDMATDGSPTLQQLLGVPALRTHYEQTHAPSNLRLAIAARNR